MTDQLSQDVAAEVLAALPPIEASGNGDGTSGDQQEKIYATSPERPALVAEEQIGLHYRDRAPGLLTLRYWRGCWMRWAGTHWAEVEKDIVTNHVYSDYKYATFVIPSKNGGEDTERDWDPNAYKVRNVIAALQEPTYLDGGLEPPIWLDGHEEGKPPARHLIACRNGLLDVMTRRLHQHTPAFFNVISVPFDYDPAAPPPTRWLAFLAALWPDDPDQIVTLQEWFGYVLSGRTDLHKILLLIGPLRGGKGTVARILLALLGKANVAGPTLSSLGQHFGLAPLIGKPLAIISDARLSGGADTHQVVERLLTISGEDSITIDRKYREAWTGRLPTRFTIMSNELPRFGDASGAIVTRFLLLTLTQSWLGKEDFNLEATLLVELPGILNWALDGLTRLIEQGRLTEPRSSVDALTAMADLASPVSAFVRDRCEVNPVRREPIQFVFEAWRQWCALNGREHPGSVQSFGRDLRAVVPRLRESRPRLEPGGPQVRCYEGIALVRP